MALYLTPFRNKKSIEDFLKLRYPVAQICESELCLGEARDLVRSICDDQTIEQPAVKLLSPYDSFAYSALLGIILHWHNDFVGILTADHRTSQFLFHKTATHLNQLKWVHLKLSIP